MAAMEMTTVKVMVKVMMGRGDDAIRTNGDASFSSSASISSYLRGLRSDLALRSLLFIHKLQLPD